MAPNPGSACGQLAGYLFAFAIDGSFIEGTALPAEPNETGMVVRLYCAVLLTN
ncbi:hypothetical protein [Fibrella aquatilis]|uniref:Uncharacterized protein n=1 Tax=Fibrella aquatilis TaxID=2817059 RepID=A0A939G4Z3_9BACT|nr:hypothetical protein [Fibrella aquatilis]MBO0930719.1 hypothetical protein [Fibrella aquatilis]